MDYQQNAVRQTTYPEQSKEPLASNVLNRMRDVQETQFNLLYEIEGKLHNILNLRVPEKETISPVQKELNSDFYSTVNSEISKMYEVRDRLEKIVKHLSQII